MYLQERDKEILKICYEQQFLLPKQITKHFFSECHERKSLQRIQELIGAGILIREKAITLNKGSLLRLTKVGRKIAEQLSSFEVPHFRRLDTATLEHDSIVTSVRLKLEKTWDGHWIPETVLKDKYDQIPDGIFQFSESRNSFALEIENSFKGRSRFQNILRGWEKYHTSIQMVLFVATSDRLFSFLKDQLKVAPSKPAFGLVLLSSLFTEQRILTPVGEIDLFSSRAF